MPVSLSPGQPARRLFNGNTKAKENRGSLSRGPQVVRRLHERAEKTQTRRNMKINLTSVLTMVSLVSALVLNASEIPQPKPGSAEFERLKTLVGTWKGTADMGQGPIEMTVQYRLLAGGTVLEERVFQGTPMEMVTMFYDKDGKLALTHYCVMGNRPGMVLKSSDTKTLAFEFDKTCGIDPLTGTLMNGLTLRFDDADTITASCKAVINGQPQKEHPTTLKRVKALAKSE
jgi:hypothetical protein